MLVKVLLILEIFALIYYWIKYRKIYYQLLAKELGFIFKFDSELGYTFKPNLVHQRPTVPLANAPRRIFGADIQTNEDGFMFKGKTPKNAIFCLGGSVTAGVLTRSDESYPAILNSLLKQRCVNAGVGGYRSIHELLYFKKRVLPYKPSKVIILSGFNDFEDFACGFYESYNPFRHCLENSLASNKITEFLDKIAFFHLSKRIFYRISGRVKTENNPAKKIAKALNTDIWLEEWKNNMKEIIQLCHKNHIECYLLSHPLPVYEDAPQEVKDFADKELNMAERFDIYLEFSQIIHKAIVNLCEKENAEFIDIRKDFPMDYKKRFLLFVDRVHLSAEGNSLVAKAIYKRLKNLEKELENEYSNHRI